MRRCLVLALLLASGLVVLAPAHPALAAPGWKLLWSTQFNGTDIPDKCARYGGSYDIGDSYWVSEEATVSGGYLRLGIREGSKGGQHYLSGGVTCYQVSLKYGKFEWRAKVPPGKGIDSYATLWPDDDLSNQAALLEILGVPGKEQLSITNEYGSGKVGGDVYGHYTDAFHTYAIEWSPTRFRVLVDGVSKYTSNRVCTVKRSIGFAVSNGDNFTGVPDANTPLPAQFQIDWLKVYSYVADAPAPKPPASSTTPPARATTRPPAGTAPPATVAATAGSGPAGGGAPAGAGDVVLTGGGSSGWGWWALAALVVLLVAGTLRALRPRWRASTMDREPPTHR